MKRFIAILLLGLGAVGAYYYYTQVYLPATAVASAPERQGSRRGGGRGEGPVAVLATPARLADVPVTIDAIGTVQALNTVTVRAQVDGKLMKLAFRDGQDVKASEVLAQIDPTTYRAAYDQAVAKKAQDAAQLANARSDLDRYERLAKTQYGSLQQADNQRSLVAQYDAQVRSDQGAIDNAKAILDYTTIRAPIDGRTGIRTVDEGNIIRASDATGLVVITQLKPISVIFNLPQQQLRTVSQAMAQRPVSVQAFDSDAVTLLDDGVVTVVDNQVDQTTGTVRFKSNFPNDRLQLWPGQFLNVKLLITTLKDATVVPTAAVQRGPSGPFVYTVGDDNTVTLRQVVVGQQSETQSVITSGLAPPTRVVTTGFTRLTDGATVTVTDTDIGDAARNALPPPGNRGERRQRRGREGEAAAPSDRSGGRRQQSGEDKRTGAGQGTGAGEGTGAPPPTASESASSPAASPPAASPPAAASPSPAPSPGAAAPKKPR